MSSNVNAPNPAEASCPTPFTGYEQIIMAHGGGGRLMRDLIDQRFVSALSNPLLDPMDDGSLLKIGSETIAMTTDSFVIHPLEFPGGNIGSLAVHGTVNDLAMCGAEPLALSLGVILEEGLSIERLQRIIDSIAEAAQAVPVPIATGDTKVVERGSGDGIFINTTGIGRMLPNVQLGAGKIQPGDAILINGNLAEHGVTILSVRESLGFSTTLESDQAELWSLVRPILEQWPGDVRFLRDPTRGGVATTLNELAESSGLGIQIEETTLPLREEVRGACELLGLDPLYVANEGKCIAVVRAAAAADILAKWRQHPRGQDARIIGAVTNDHPGQVRMNGTLGGQRIVPLLSGEQLPRIC
jgi:hydrogenase expression/formation protein HypE